MLFLFIFLLLLLIRSPWGQNLIVSKATKYISDKTNTKVEIDRLFITFTGNAFLEGVYLEDKKGDTLFYSKTLEANLPLSPLIFQNELNLKSLDWNGVTANIVRASDTEKFNYQFLLDALMSRDTAAPQPAAAPMKVSLGTFDLSDITLNYNDAYLGLYAKFNVGNLVLQVDKADLENMRYEIDELNLSYSNIGYKQTKPFVSKDDTEITLPFVVVKQLQVNNVHISYNSIPYGLLADVLLGEFKLELPKADLATNEVDIDLLSLKDSDIFVQLQKDDLASVDATSTPSQNADFLWPKFLIKADEINLANNSIQYHANNNAPQERPFDPNHINLTELTLRARDLNYQPKNARLTLEQFSFMEKSGFMLQQLAMEASLDDTSASIGGIEIKTASSSLMGSLKLEYPSLNQFFSFPKSTKVDLEVSHLNLALQEALVFEPKLAKNEFFIKGQLHPFSGNINISGTLDNLHIPSLNLNWHNTTLTGQGHLFRVTETDSLSFDIARFKATTTKADIRLFVPEENLNISLPETILVYGHAKGSLKSITGDAHLEIPEGNAQITGNYSSTDRINFNGNLKVDSLQVGKLLKNKQLGTMSFNVKTSGSGKTLNTLNSEIESNFTKLDLLDYDFSNLELYGKITDGKGDISLNFKDYNLNFTSNTAVVLDSLNSKFSLNLNVIGADLQALGLTTENIRAGLLMEVHFLGNPKNYVLDAFVKNGIAVYDGQQYHMGDFKIKSNIDTLKTEVSINSDFINGRLLSNATPQGINSSLTQYLKYHLQKTPATVTKADSLKLQMDFKLASHPILTEVFFKELEQLDTINARVNFDATTKDLVSELHVPNVKYNGITLDSLNFAIIGDAKNLNFKAGMANLLADPVHVGRTYLEGNLKNKELLLDFNSYKGKEKVAHIASEMTLANDTTLIHINPSGLLFNRKEWTIPEDNRISLATKFLEFKNIKLNRNSQQFTVVSSLTETSVERLKLTFEQFKLQTFLSILNPDQALVAGVLNGDFNIENPYGATGIVADFNLDQLEILEHPIGNLSLNANSKTNGRYDFKLSLRDGGANLDLKGDYAAAKTGALLNLDLDINRLDLAFIEQFSNGAMKDSHGTITGNIDIAGTTATPEYRGTLSFHDTDFNVATLNSVFKISDETLNIDNQGLYLNNFKISDANGNNFKMNGTIGTEELMNPTFDLKLNAEQFQALNSTKEDNELFYGKASFDLDLSVKGNLKLPQIQGKIFVRKITDITFVVPKEQLDVQEREGVVLFVNRQNPDAILTRNENEENVDFFSGIDANVNLEIADDSDFRIIIDERMGDNLKVSGNGSLYLNIEPNGRTNLTGRYELQSGYYETSLYNLVKRRFEISPGSTITWEGDPTDAKLGVKAVYKVETSAAPLMSSVTSGEDISVTGKYRQVLPFLVYLNVDGELLEPKLSFGLDMPEDEQGSLGGAVYGRVQQLNQQEAELNKQVFSLLALNRFYPSSGSDGSIGGTAAIAQDNVNKVLSGQLNAFSDKIFGSSGFEVDFDLDSFTDYQGDSPQDRTQLDINAKKKLFDERLVVTAGSAIDVEGSAQPGQGETPIIGNVSLEYLLTKDGRYRLRGFRKNQYTNIIDGQLIVTGIALIFNMEFNKFSQLFNPLKETGDQGDKEKEENKKE
ncbi:translocation/assembly module TamB domain-containing protein [Sediminicola sp. YIK13]|uniref:translocation/assembly module TamB domain-containing protein n=1 Tax=Sediminicola sp. YIK13 TaxID=1453352 RepID=UPI00138F493D|nr:translocation/assembly module TamB domain-containing protein [Sediminicola sp. YIK13]